MCAQDIDGEAAKLAIRQATCRFNRAKAIAKFKQKRAQRTFDKRVKLSADWSPVPSCHHQITSCDSRGSGVSVCCHSCMRGREHPCHLTLDVRPLVSCGGRVCATLLIVLGQ